MNHISLFSGLGGFDLASEWMGWNNIAHCEMNDFCLKILKYYWPHAKTHTDIRTTDFSIYRGQCDIITGGFPCQPYSTAGKRLGKADERHLWPHMLRAIQEISPRWVVGENVRGLVSWNGGMVFDEVQTDLESAGYEVTPFILPAASVGCDHRRDRVWFVAHTECIGRWEEDKRGLGMEERLLQKSEWKESTIGHQTCAISSWIEAATALCQPLYGISSGLVNETVSGWESKGLHAAGNAIVPQVAYNIFQAIDQYENL